MVLNIEIELHELESVVDIKLPINSSTYIPSSIHTKLNSHQAYKIIKGPCVGVQWQARQQTEAAEKQNQRPTGSEFLLVVSQLALG